MNNEELIINYKESKDYAFGVGVASIFAQRNINCKNKFIENTLGACIARPKSIKSNANGITLIALIITILLSYDEIRKYSNSNEFLLPINC